MLIYTEHNDPDLPSADIHNVDTGITYSIEMLAFPDGNTPAVTMRTADAMVAENSGVRLYTGKQAVDFWKALLYRYPHSSTSVGPHTYLRTMLGGVEEGDESENTENEGLPF